MEQYENKYSQINSLSENHIQFQNTLAKDKFEFEKLKIKISNIYNAIDSVSNHNDNQINEIICFCNNFEKKIEDSIKLIDKIINQDLIDNELDSD